MKHDESNLNPVAANATLHCLTGCSIGEVSGMVISAIAHLGSFSSVVISIGLSFVFGYTLSILPLLSHGLILKKAASLVLAADTLSIAAMEFADNLVMLVVPGAMNATLVNPLFWISLSLSLFIAFWAAFPVNKYLLKRGKGHALVHQYHEGH